MGREASSITYCLSLTTQYRIPCSALFLSHFFSLSSSDDIHVVHVHTPYGNGCHEMITLFSGLRVSRNHHVPSPSTASVVMRTTRQARNIICGNASTSRHHRSWRRVLNMSPAPSLARRPTLFESLFTVMCVNCQRR